MAVPGIDLGASNQCSPIKHTFRNCNEFGDLNISGDGCNISYCIVCSFWPYLAYKITVLLRKGFRDTNNLIIDIFLKQ